MVIELTPEQEALILEAAQQEGKNIGQFLVETVRWRLETEQGEEESFQRGVAQLDRGEFIEHGEMQRRVARMLSSQ